MPVSGESRVIVVLSRPLSTKISNEPLTGNITSAHVLWACPPRVFPSGTPKIQKTRLISKGIIRFSRKQSDPRGSVTFGIFMSKDPSGRCFSAVFSIFFHYLRAKLKKYPQKFARYSKYAYLRTAFDKKPTHQQNLKRRKQVEGCVQNTPGRMGEWLKPAVC